MTRYFLPGLSKSGWLGTLFDKHDACQRNDHGFGLFCQPGRVHAFRASGLDTEGAGLKRTRHQRHRSHVGTVIGVLGSYINRHVFAYRNDSDAGRRVCVVADRGDDRRA